ncbi:MAG: hypothetical protein HRU70_03310 [Phycisphaeraceae bacterium]|nr:MAG: hypothetical protein HRU70_03310 [Phycisphaeraceae bacterium]
MRFIGLVAAFFACVPGVTALGQKGEPIAQPGATPQPPRVEIRGVEYQRLATREATEERMMNLLVPGRASWGEWHALVPFEFKKQGDLKLVLPPEEALASMGVNGPGPDLSRAFAGRGGVEAKWKNIGAGVNRTIDLGLFTPQGQGDWVVGYLHGTVTAPVDMTIDATCGSDDGLRLWLNGRLIVDADAMRGLDAEDHRLKLDLKKGVNHLFAKVSQGMGAFQFQLNAGEALDPLTAQMLEYHLEVDFPSTPEARYFRTLPVALPADVVLEVGGLDVLPDGRPVVCTRRGEVYIVDGAYEEPPMNARFTLFAEGLHEPLGLQVRAEQRGGKPVNAVYAVQRGELTRMIDLDGDDRADVYETVSDAWGVSGNYHEFAFGPKFDSAGNAWVTLNVGFCDALGKSLVPWRGWSLRVDREGRATPVSGGLRSPNGIGFWNDGQAFYLDNQGDFVGTNRLAPMYDGGWNGHPSGLRWRSDYTPAMDTPAGRPPLTPAAVWFPYKKMGQSTADMLLLPAGEAGSPGAGVRAKGPLPDGGGVYAFGPYAGQAFVGDQTLCLVMRVSLEKIDGVYQGACYPFRQGLQCGVNRLAWGKDGSMFVGQTDRGWGSIGRRRYGLERIVWTGETPFEVREVRVTPEGFAVEFTKDIDPAVASDPASYACLSYTYRYHATYGSPEIETGTQRVVSARVAGPREVRLTIDSIRSGGMGYVHELTFGGVRAAGTGEPLLHPIAYYTVQRVPTKTE